MLEPLVSGERAPLEALLQALQDEDATVRSVAREAVKTHAPEALVAMARDAERILLGAARTPEEAPLCGAQWQVTIARSLGELGLIVPETLDRLSRMLDWPHWRVKVAAAEALGKIKRHMPSATIQRLYELRNDPAEYQVVREACDDALAEILAVDPMEDTI